MKKTTWLAAAFAAFVMTSCASFNGTSAADINHDGVVTKAEQDRYDRSLATGYHALDYEQSSFQHVDDMAATAERLIDRLQRL